MAVSDHTVPNVLHHILRAGISELDFAVGELYALPLHLCKMYKLLVEPYTEYHTGICVVSIFCAVGSYNCKCIGIYAHIHRKALISVGLEG